MCLSLRYNYTHWYILHTGIFDHTDGRLTMEKLLKNPFFTLERLEDGVWAAIVVPGNGAVANASII